MTRLRRGMALVSGAALLATMTAATVAAPTSAAEPMCRGVEATITGTPGDDVLLGTDGRDVIVGLAGDDIILGRGGNDLICGGLGQDRIAGQGGRDRLFGNGGPDRLFGGKGPDRLFGGVGDDLLAGRVGNDGLIGGPGTDRCYQNQGQGLVVGCELPVAAPTVEAPKVVPMTKPAPPPEAPKPDPIDLTNVIAIAYTDINQNHAPDAGDVMIAQLVDTDNNGPDEGDIVEMGLFPTKHQPTWPTDFAGWQIQSHTVQSVRATPANQVMVESKPAGGVSAAVAAVATHSWLRGAFDQYSESITPHTTNLCEGCASGADAIETAAGSPSQPLADLHLQSPGAGDGYFIEVELYLPQPS